VKIELNVIGPAKSGKSRLIEVLMEAIQANHFSTDIEIREIRESKPGLNDPGHVAAGRVTWDFKTGRVTRESEDQLNRLR
jgi:nicotinamide riboside kinase